MGKTLLERLEKNLLGKTLLGRLEKTPLTLPERLCWEDSVGHTEGLIS